MTVVTRRHVGEDNRSIVTCAGKEILLQTMGASCIPTEGANGREGNGAAQPTVRKTANSEEASRDALVFSILDTTAEGQVFST